MSSTEFNDLQYESIYPEGVENHYWTIARNQIIFNALETDSHSTILDVGCGRGIVVSYLRQMGLNCLGIELAKVKINGKIADYIFTGIKCDELSHSIKEKVEIILLLDVLEHIQNPNDFLDGLHLTFPRLRKLIITVPARMELWSNIDTFNGHFKRYTIETLPKDIHLSGWSIQNLRYFFQLLYFPMLMFSVFNIKRKEKISAPSGFAKFAHSLFAKALLSNLISQSFYGSSLLAVMIKNVSLKKV